MTDHTPPTDQQLDDIDARQQAATPGPWCTDSWEIYQGTEYVPGISEWIGETCRGASSLKQDRADAAFVAAARSDVPALLAEVRRLRDHVAELETYALGCDAEGCTTPHSSWCERAKTAAAENDGCTCPQPWKDSPQPHAGYCWLVSPPRDEIEQARKRIAELAAENAKLIRWHREDETALAEMRATIARLRTELTDQRAYEQRLREQHDHDVTELARLRDRVAELERPAVEAKRNEIRQSYTDLIAQAEQDRDPEGAFDVQCRLREREEQWKREDAPAAPAAVVGGVSGSSTR